MEGEYWYMTEMTHVIASLFQNLHKIQINGSDIILQLFTMV